MCLFKSFIGALTTSIRMHESIRRGCLFGCSESCDDIQHYIVCSPLWQIACQALEVNDPFNIEERLCLVRASPIRAQLLSLVFCLYYAVHGITRGTRGTVSGTLCPRFIQQSVVEQERAYRHIFSDGKKAFAPDKFVDMHNRRACRRMVITGPLDTTQFIKFLIRNSTKRWR